MTFLTSGDQGWLRVGRRNDAIDGTTHFNHIFVLTLTKIIVPDEERHVAGQGLSQVAQQSLDGFAFV